MIIKNPYDAEQKKYNMGKRVVVIGPKTLSLYPGEQVGTEPTSAYILNKGQYLVVQANDDFVDKLKRKRTAGELYTVTGPTSFIPNIYETIVPNRNGYSIRDAISIPDNEAVYIRNTDTSELRLVNGPVSYVLQVNEEEYAKELNSGEYEALSLPHSARSEAYVVQVQKNQCVCVLNYKTNTETYVLGPDRVILGPQDGLKVLSLSGGVPKEENQLKVAIIGLGIDFMTDQFTIRTKDNAVLNLTVTYKWKFILDDDNLYKIFAGDFIGYSCQSLRSRIREESSKHNFETFQQTSSQILREKLFKEYDIEIRKGDAKVREQFFGRYFGEFNFLVFSVDVKGIKPVDREIEQLLENSIKASMRIMCSKLNDNAETQAEKERIESETELSKLRQNLIEIENNNLTKEKIEKAKIEAQVMIEKATSEAEAATMLKKVQLELQLQEMKSQMDLLAGEAGDRYIEYVKIMSMNENVNHAIIVPSSTRNLINLGGSSGSYNIEEITEE
jgi:major vault protein